MKNKGLEQRLSDEILAHIESRKTLILSSLDDQGFPYASYAPFAFQDDALYILISEIALHGKYLAINQTASVLIIEDEDSADELFARKRVVYKIQAEIINESDDLWSIGIDALTQRQGERITNLSKLSDFKLFKLNPLGGRYVKGFGKAYTIEGGKLTGDGLGHLTEGHRKKEAEIDVPA